MKAITLWQPWATLIAIGAKRLETRSWSTSYRGPLAIHASAKWDKPLAKLSVQEPYLSVLRAGGVRFNDRGFPSDATLPLGAIVATCRLVEVFKIERDRLVDPRGEVYALPQRPEFHFGDYTPGRYAWSLTDILKLERPMPASGARQLWEWDGHPPVAKASSPRERSTRGQGQLFEITREGMR